MAFTFETCRPLSCRTFPVLGSSYWASVAFIGSSARYISSELEAGSRGFIRVFGEMPLRRLETLRGIRKAAALGRATIGHLIICFRW